MRAKSHTLMLTQLDSGLPAAWQVWHHLLLRDTQFPSKVLQGWVTLNRRDGPGENQQPLVMRCLFLSHFVLNCCDLSVSSAWAVGVKSNLSPVCQDKLEKTPEHNRLGFLLAVSVCTRTAAHSCPPALRPVACLAAPQRMSNEPQTISLKAGDIRNEESSLSAVESPHGLLLSFRERIVISGKRDEKFVLFIWGAWGWEPVNASQARGIMHIFVGVQEIMSHLDLSTVSLMGELLHWATTDRHIRAILLRTISENTRLCIQISGAVSRLNSCTGVASLCSFLHKCSKHLCWYFCLGLDSCLWLMGLLCAEGRILWWKARAFDWQASLTLTLARSYFTLLALDFFICEMGIETPP